MVVTHKFWSALTSQLILRHEEVSDVVLDREKIVALWQACGSVRKLCLDRVKLSYPPGTLFDGLEVHHAMQDLTLEVSNPKLPSLFGRVVPTPGNSLAC